MNQNYYESELYQHEFIIIQSFPRTSVIQGPGPVYMDLKKTEKSETQVMIVIVVGTTFAVLCLLLNGQCQIVCKSAIL